jgi:hypothetical protein
MIIMRERERVCVCPPSAFIPNPIPNFASWVPSLVCINIPEILFGLKIVA